MNQRDKASTSLKPVRTTKKNTSETAEQNFDILAIPLRNLLVFPALFLLIILLSFSFLTELAARTRGKPRLDVPTLTVEDLHLVVSSRLKDAFSTELEKTLESGKKIDFYFYVELCRPRFSFFYPDEKLWRGTQKHSVHYNPATREYAITIEMNSKKDIKYTDNPDDMMNWINKIRFQIPDVFGSVEETNEYYIRMWMTADTKPLPGGFTTRTINSKRFIPSRFLVEHNKPRPDEVDDGTASPPGT